MNMKRIILVLAVLMLTVPASAAVTIWAYNEPWLGADDAAGADCNLVHVVYDASSEPNLVRAFALEIKLLDPNATADNALIDFVGVDYHVGECNSTDRGYGIFPGSIQIDGGGNVTDDGSPVVGGTVDVNNVIDVDANSMIIEMGSLYTGANSPPTTGELLTFRVNNKVCRIVITENVARGGVVMENPSESVTVTMLTKDVRLSADMGSKASGGLLDGVVNAKDFSILSNNWKAKFTDPAADVVGPSRTAPNGKCDAKDFTLLSEHWKVNWK